MLLVFLLAAFTVSAEAFSCIITGDNGSTDLSGVQSISWEQQQETTNYWWYIDLCNQGQGICESSDYDGFIQQSGPDSKNLCAQNAWFAEGDSESGGQGTDILLSYTGNVVPHTQQGRKADLTITCDDTGSYDTLTNPDVSVTQVGNTFQYSFSAKSKIACKGAPSGAPGSTPPDGSPSAPGAPPTPGEPSNGSVGGWVFVGILLGLMFFYIVGGLVFNAAVKKQRGAEMFPNLEFWKDFPGLVKDGVMFSLSPCLKR